MVGFVAISIPGQLARLRGDLLAALAYFTNWYLIVHQQSYFQALGRPSLLQHLWSLAIEEQYYLIWPLTLLLLARLTRGRIGLLFWLVVVGGSLPPPPGCGSYTSPSRIHPGSTTAPIPARAAC